MPNLAQCKFAEAFQEPTQVTKYDGKTGISSHVFVFGYQNEVP